MLWVLIRSTSLCAGPDQLASEETNSDLDLHCLQRQGIYLGSTGSWLRGHNFDSLKAK